jgi:ABC-type branched-subunit amino acid transport system substrate-binding protein
MPINPLSKQKGIPLVGPVGAQAFTAQNDLALRVYPNPLQESGFAAALARKLGKSRAAIVVVEDEFALALAAGIEKGLQKPGAKSFIALIFCLGRLIFPQ